MQSRAVVLTNDMHEILCDVLAKLRKADRTDLDALDLPGNKELQQVHNILRNAKRIRVVTSADTKRLIAAAGDMTMRIHDDPLGQDQAIADFTSVIDEYDDVTDDGFVERCRAVREGVGQPDARLRAIAVTLFVDDLKRYRWGAVA